MNLSLLIPEWTAAAAFFLLLIAETLKGPSQKLGDQDTRSFSALSILGILITLFVVGSSHVTGNAFSNFYKADALARDFKLLFAGIALVIMMLAHHFLLGAREKVESFILIVWVTLLGMFFLASANDLFLAFLTIEIITLSFYIMAAYLKRDILAIESGLKYLIMGSLASAFIIFGIGLIYVAAGSTNFDAVREFVQNGGPHQLFLIGLIMVFCGVGFKIASVPFHLWVPDVYEGAPSPTVAFLSTGSKSAGFLFLIRLLNSVYPAAGKEWVLLISILAAMTLIYGNLGALNQHSFKRLLGYSSIGHAGYLLIGIAAGGIQGIASVLYYLAAYAVSNLTVFTVMSLVEKEPSSQEISSYTGLSKRSPLLAAALFVSLISLAGVPPTAGFFGKFLVLLAAVQSNLGWLALVGLIFVVVSLYYYLSVIRLAYSESEVSDSPIIVSMPFKILLLVLIAGVFVLGLFQSPLYSHLLSTSSF